MWKDSESQDWMAGTEGMKVQSINFWQPVKGSQ